MPFTTALIIITSTVILSVYPFSPNVVEFMPSWILILALLFMYHLPLRLGLSWMFFCGLFSDMLSHVYLGSEALLFVVIGMIFRWVMAFFSSSSGLGKLVLTAVFILLYEALKMLLFAWLYRQDLGLIEYQPLVVSALIGTIILFVLHNLIPKVKHEV